MEKTFEQKAVEIAKLITDGKGRDVTLLDISGLNSWADYFVIATVTSSAQQQGLAKQIKDYIKENDLEIHPTNRRSPNGEDWELIDLGNIVVHLMSEQAREFYNLDKLYREAPEAQKNESTPREETTEA